MEDGRLYRLGAAISLAIAAITSLWAYFTGRKEFEAWIWPLAFLVIGATLFVGSFFDLSNVRRGYHYPLTEAEKDQEDRELWN